MEGNIKTKIQTNSMIANHQRYSTVTIYTLNMRGVMQYLGLVKGRATQLKPGKIRIDDISYQPEKLHTEDLLELLSKVITQEINTNLKNECKAYFDPAVQVHSYYLNNPP